MPAHRGSTGAQEESRLAFGHIQLRQVKLAGVLVAVLLVLGGTAFAFADGRLNVPIKFAFRPFSSSPPLSSFSLTCPPSQETSLEQAVKAARFRVYAVRPGSWAELKSVIVMPPCSNQPNFSPTVQLNYLMDGVSLQLLEGPAADPGQPLTVTLKGKGPSTYPWKLVDIGGSTYAVSVLPAQDKFGDTNGVSGGMWQQGNTFLSLNAESSAACQSTPDCYYNRGMTLDAFTYVVRNLAPAKD